MNETSPLKWNLFNPDEYEKARKWLEKIGLCLEPTRISKLLNITKEWNHVDSKQYTSDEVWGILELDDIYRIYKGLEQVDIKGFSDQLKKTLSGSVYIKDENVKCSSNKGRNYIFELYTASRFACSNFQIFFDSDADFNFKVGDYTFNVECKRVVS
jgi:hypothetical protein